MGLSVDDIIAKFPMKNLPIISGEPDYDSINTMVQFLYGNAASLPTTLGGGQHGHIGLIMTHILYATLAPNTAYNSPIDPGLLPPMASNLAVVTRETRKTCWRVEITLISWLSNEPTNVGSLLFATNYWTSVLMHGCLTYLRHATIWRYIPPVPVLPVRLPD